MAGIRFRQGHFMKENMVVSGFDSFRFISGSLSGERYPGCSGRDGGAIGLFKRGQYGA